MAALSAPTDIRPDANTNAGLPVQYGATVVFGTVVYLDATDNKHKVAKNNGTATESKAVGIVVTPGVDTGFGYIASTPGSIITLTGVSMTVGDTYFLGTSGAIVPQGDVTTGRYVTRLGTAYSATQLLLSIEATLIVRP